MLKSLFGKTQAACHWLYWHFKAVSVGKQDQVSSIPWGLTLKYPLAKYSLTQADKLMKYEQICTQWPIQIRTNSVDFLLRYNQQKVVKGPAIFPAGLNRQQQVLVVYLTHKQKMSPQVVSINTIRHRDRLMFCNNIRIYVCTTHKVSKYGFILQMALIITVYYY